MKIIDIQTFKDLKKEKMYRALLEYLHDENRDKGYILPDDILLTIYDTLQSKERSEAFEVKETILKNFISGYRIEEIADMLEIAEVSVTEAIASYVQDKYREEITMPDGTQSVPYVTEINGYLRNHIFIDGWEEELKNGIIFDIAKNYGITVEEVENIVDNFICRL